MLRGHTNERRHVSLEREACIFYEPTKKIARNISFIFTWNKNILRPPVLISTVFSLQINTFLAASTISPQVAKAM